MLRAFQIVILVLGLSLVALASAILTMRFAIHGSEVTIPSFKGLTAEEALNKAASLGVDMTIDNRFYSAEVPAGRILAQSPAAGTAVRREWHVRATESLGPQSVEIPNLVGQPQRAASIQIRRAGLELGGVAQLPSDASAAGNVIAQDPQAGAAGVEKPSVSIVVGTVSPARGAAFVMPNLVGQPYSTAVAIMAGAGLTLAARSETPSGRASGIVVDQQPAAGCKVDGGVQIRVRLE